jgi:CBS domain-containing protein
MNIDEIMTREPTCCSPDMDLAEVAAMMVVEDCGQIPVCGHGSLKPIGVITDRDIVCRAIAKRRNPIITKASACMSEPCVVIPQDATVEECCRLMEEHQVRRLPVIDENGELCGVVSLADVAAHSHEALTGQVIKTISQRTESARRDMPARSRAA